MVPSRRSLLAAGGSVAVAGVAGYGAVSALARDGEAPPSDETGGDETHDDVPVHGSSATTSLGLDLAGTPILGHRDAALDVYYWGDYQCPFCRRFEQRVLPKLLDNELADGTIRLPLFELPAIGDASVTAAVVSRCVWRQVRESDPGAFLRWHATMYDEQGEPNSGWATRRTLLDITASVDGVDAGAVEQCLNQRWDPTLEAVREEARMARRRGIDVTPTFLVHDPESGDRELLSGAQPYQRFRETITGVRDG